ncbi:flagellar export protein FliJ [Jeotgalibaca porci]|uniref:flagellar export protein FliJ n=1 Tax=Jeotgalibaca porci TaxID=1868793 RepID=UPI00359FB0DA
MAKQFSMEKILEWRMDLEEQARMKVIQLNERLQTENHHLQELIKENRRVKNEAVDNVHIQSLRYNDYYKLVIDEKIIQQKNQIDLTRSEINAAQNKLISAHTDRKAMEKLKEKEILTYYLAEKRNEQMQLDDFATMGYKRQAL